MILRGTQKLLSFANIRSEEILHVKDESEWYVNLFYSQRSKYLLFTHAATLFSFVTKISKKDTGNLLDFFRTELPRAMFHTQCPSEMIQKVLQGCERIRFAKTINRSVVASMNEMVYNADFWLNKAVEDPIALTNIRLNSTPMKILKYHFSIEQFCALYGSQIDTNIIRKLFDEKFEDNLDIYLERELGKDAAADLKGADPIRIAQELIYEAWERPYVDEALALAHKALTICPRCADAYNLLAEEGAGDINRKADLYCQAVNAGRLELGEEFFKANKGHFWGLIEARPYMRALGGLQECLWKKGQHDNAIKICHDMLSLNENDNQGMRYVLVRYLVKLSRYDDLERFMEGGKHRTDCGTEWLYTRALLWFIKKGDGSPANTILSKALDVNKLVPDYLFRKNFHLKKLPATLTFGGEDEAQYYAHEFGLTWHITTGAIDWLKRISSSHSSSLR